MLPVKVCDKVISWITLFCTGRGNYCGNIRILWKYPHSVDIISMSWKYPHSVDIIRILWKYPHSVDIIRI